MSRKTVLLQSLLRGVGEWAEIPECYPPDGRKKHEARARTRFRVPKIGDSGEGRDASLGDHSLRLRSGADLARRGYMRGDREWLRSRTEVSCGDRPGSHTNTALRYEN